jgi:hypothetical protein
MFQVTEPRAKPWLLMTSDIYLRHGNHVRGLSPPLEPGLGLVVLNGKLFPAPSLSLGRMTCREPAFVLSLLQSSPLQVTE